MEFPEVVVNAKAYPEAMGPAALALAKALSQAASKAGRKVALAVPALELASLSRRSDLPNLAWFGQHCDDKAPGAATGWITAEALQAAGAKGSLLNHAEHKVGQPAVASILPRLLAAKVDQVVCVDSMAELRALAPLKPTAIAIEPPQLIGGDISVTTADPAIVRDAAAELRKVAPATIALCGAGVKNGHDVAAARKLGCHGVLVASGVVKAKDPGVVLADLLAGL